MAKNTAVVGSKVEAQQRHSGSEEAAVWIFVALGSEVRFMSQQ